MNNRSVSQMSRTRRLATCAMAFVLLICLAVPVAAHAQTLTTLQSFNGTNGAFPNTTLVQSRHRVVQHTNGNFYGTTPLGGANNAGTVYQVTPGGTLTTIYNFCSIGGSACTDGANPEGALVVGSDGNLYGTTYGGGASNNGTVFKISTGGALTTLYNFCSQTKCADGANPYGALAQGSGGYFYGTTYSGGGASSDGTAFKITAGGSLTTIYTFCSQTGCADGANPQGDLVQSLLNGNFYGTTAAGGNANNAGTVFEISPAGALSTVYAFCSKTNCNDGSNPQIPLTQDGFGNLYGTTAANGANAGGTLFQINTWGTLHTIYHFCSKTNCTDGAEPVGGPLVASDGNLYGPTAIGGTNNAGTVYQVTPWGVLATLYNFCSLANCADGQSPEASLAQGTNGSFYGTTAFGGADSLGTAFSLATLPTSGNSCNGVYSGTFFGNIVVSNGQSCEFTDGGTVIGNIYVTGGSLVLQNASVLGNVEIQGGTYTLGPSLAILSRLEVVNLPSSSAQNTICGVNVNGSLYFDGNGSAAEIGSTSGSCPGNVIGGDLEVESNSALVQVFDNTVRDDLTCSSNTSITGGGNTARAKIGQCSSF
jgi:uncharacterized repeat protein (TIGR03803 family)